MLMLQRELLHKYHLTCLRSTHSVNSTGSQFSGASSSNSPLSPSRRCTLVLHLTSLIFLFLTILLVFLGHLSPLTFHKSPQSPYNFRFQICPRSCSNHLELSSRLIAFVWYISLFRPHLKTHLYQAAFNTLYSGILQRLKFTYAINGAS